MAERGATELEQLVAVENSGCGGRLFVIVVFDRMVLEGQAFVEFGERNREADLRHREGVVVLQDEDAPSVLGADMDGCADPVLLEHDIALDRGRRLIFARLDDAVGGAVLGLSTSKITTGSRTTLAAGSDRSKRPFRQDSGCCFPRPGS